MNLLIRADANPQIGTGHIMRCLALAQAWREADGMAYFAPDNAAPALEARLLDESFRVCHITAVPGSADDGRQTITLARQIKAAWLVVDGYHFDANYQQAIKEAGLRLLVLDDYGHANHYWADLVLNQNIYADASLYPSHEPHTRLLLGPQYALLRREFWPWQGWRRDVPPVVRKVLVTLGGADPANITFKVIQALQQANIKGLESVVVVGSSNPHWETLRGAVEQSRHAVCLERDVTNMPELMVWADLAISAGGSTCWELAFMGLPNLILILADNQRRVAEGLSAAGISVNLGDAFTLTSAALAHALTELATAPEQRAASSRRGQELLAGDGASQVVRLIQAGQLALRPVQADDSRLLWEWTNAPATRAASFSPESIAWERHVAWFTAKLADPKALFYLALDAEGQPIGQIRFQLEGQEAVVSVSLAPNQHGRGFGSEVIRLASQHVFEQAAIHLIHAYVKPDNPASIRAFTKAGFANRGTTEVQGHSALHFVLRKDTLP